MSEQYERKPASCAAATPHTIGALMSNIGNFLKQEIARIAKKEVRNQTESLKKTSAQYRKLIAALRRQVTELERKVSRLQHSVAAGAKSQSTESSAQAAAGAATGGGTNTKIRTPGPAAINALRERLGLSIAEFARLVGVSSQSVYNWQQGKTRPRGQQLIALSGTRGLGKREVRARLQVTEAAGGGAGKRRAPRKTRIN
jgi:DNA-binding transcriptional regulator YiaG